MTDLRIIDIEEFEKRLISRLTSIDVDISTFDLVVAEVYHSIKGQYLKK